MTASSEPSSNPSFEPVAEIEVDPDRGRVYEHGWQSWSPTTDYPVGETSHRPISPDKQTMCWRPGLPGPAAGFQGEGLLAVDSGVGEPVRVFAARGLLEVPSIRATLTGSRLVISSNAPVDELAFGMPLHGAVAAWADAFAASVGRPPLRPAPTVWCSWYQYYEGVDEAAVLENLAAIEQFQLPVDVIQIDDGWQAAIGDWLESSGRFPSVADLAKRICDRERQAGLWLAPFLVGQRSRLAREHPEWLVPSVDAGQNWNQRLLVLDVTHPGAAAYLREVFSRLQGAGFSYFKIDFCYAGALPGRRHLDVPELAAYRQGLELIRSAVGPDAFVLGCGAPILPSIGLVDAMRVAPDVDLIFEPQDGDMSQPSLRTAELSVVGRAWQHGRFWVNDPDCLLLRPSMPHRAKWAALIERYGGLRASSDRILDLDPWGLETTRRLLSSVPPPVPFADG